MSNFAKEILENNIEQEIKKSYLNYAMSTIVNRALPDVKDGLKPVHRRILYAMYRLGNTWNKPFKKSARIVGDVLGKYHPHGETAVYETIVRMVQKFTLRYTLLEGQGNFGSIDGDPAAAMRYTEIKLAKITTLMLDDIENNTVEFIPNYDATEIQPSLLPTKIPNILINGTTGIAVGLATNIPPHNITEIIDGILHLLHNPKSTVTELMLYIKGPDFPTAGIIHGTKGIKKAYTTGKGLIEIKANILIEDNKIIINELPYQVNKLKLIEKIVELVKSKKITNIDDLTDESDKDGLRIVIKTSKQNNIKTLINNLYKNTPLKITYGINMVALVNGIPKLLNLKEILEQFILHRKKIILNKLTYELELIQNRLHILNGLKIIHLNITKVLEIIKKGENRDDIKKNLKESLLDYEKKNIILSETQLDSILDLQLYKLSQLEKNKIEQEIKKHTEDVLSKNVIIKSNIKLKEYLENELLIIKKEYKDERKTSITEYKTITEKKDLIEKKKIIVIITKKNYIKTQDIDFIKIQKRGGKGKKIINLKENDIVTDAVSSTTHDNIFIATSNGTIYNMNTLILQEFTEKKRGFPLINFIPELNKKEIIKIMITLNSKNEENVQLVFTTRHGVIKKTSLEKFKKIKKTGTTAIKIKNKDSLVSVNTLVNAKNAELLLLTTEGKLIKIKADVIKETNRNTQGVLGIRLNKKDSVINSLTIDEQTKKNYLVTITENGFGKRTEIDEFKLTKRGTVGVFYIKKTEKTGKIVSNVIVQKEDELFLISENGVLTRIKVTAIPKTKRNSQGVQVINLTLNDKLKQIKKIT